MARNTWLSNFGKSVKFGAIEAAKDLNPAIKKLHEDNQEFMSNISQTLSDIHRGQSSISEALAKSSPDLAKTLEAINRVGLRTRNDIKHFLKTGNMQGGRDTAAPGGGAGGAGGGTDDFSKDFDFGEDDFDFSDLPSPEEAMSGVSTSSPETAAVASVGAAQIEASNKNTQATLLSGKTAAESIAKTNTNLRQQTAIMTRGIQINSKMLGQLSTATISTFQAVGTKLSGQLTMINDNLANLVEFNNDTHVKYTMAAMAYFDQSLEQLKIISGAALRMSPEPQTGTENQTDYERIFGGGGFDLSSYMGTLKSNLQKTELGPLVGFIENPEMLVQALENPVQMVTTQLIKTAVPQVMKGAMDELNKSVESFFPALLAKLSGLGNDPNSNMFVQTIGKLFGVEAPSATPNLGAYNKGAVPFDGITHKTINQVIPTYLSKILATLSGGEERMFNHDTGKFETLSDIRARHKIDEQSMRDSALGEFGQRLSDSHKNLVFENENEARIFKEAIEGFKDAVVNSGQFVNWNNEDQMADLMQRVQVQGMTEAMRSAMQDWIAYNARLMPRHEQMRAATAAYDYALQKQRNMKNGADRGDFSTWYANSNFTDIDSAHDAIGANRRYGSGGGYYPPGGGSPGGPGGHGGGQRFVGPFIRDQYEKEQRINQLTNKDNPNYGKEVGAGKASFDDLMAGGAKFAMDIQKEYLDNIKKKSASAIKNAHPEDLLDDGYFPEEGKARRRARMSTAEKLKDVAYNKPAGILASAINSINETLYRTLFGAGPDEESLLQIMADNINSVFSKIREFVVDDLYHPMKRFLFGPDFKKTNFYQFFAGLFKRGSDVMRGEQDSDGNWKGGMASDVMNEFSDAGRAIRNVITGKGYKDSKGVDHPENKDSVLGNIQQAFKAVWGTLKRYVFGGEENKQDEWKSQFMNEMKESDSFRAKSRRLKNKIIDTINGNKAAGGRLRRAGTYILSKGEKVIDGHLASGTVNETGAYDLDAGDTVVPAKDISKSRLDEGNFFAGVLQKTYGKVTDKLDQVIQAIHGTTRAVETSGAGEGGMGSKAATIDRINQLIGDINNNSGRKTEKTPFIDVIFNKVANSLSQFAGVLGGSKNFDNKFVQKEYAKAIRKKAPKAIAHGALGGLGLGLATMAGAGGTFGSYGLLSFFLPGGFIGSALLGLGLGILHQNDSFLNFMYGKKGADGKRMGGVIPKKLQTFLAKNKTGLLGGALMGAIKGFTGFSIPGFLAAILPGGGVAGSALGAIGTIGTGLMGPVLFGSAVGLAVKSEGMKKFLFGTGNEKDGKKAKGVLNGKMAGQVKKFFPNAAVGAGLGWLTGSAVGSMGIIGSLALGPYTGAIMGGALGIGMASDRFKDALFGKYDEKKKKFVSGGLVDSMKEALSLEIIRPLSVFGQKSLAKMEHFITTDIIYPIAKAVMPYKVLATKIFTGITNKLQEIMTGVGNGISSVFNTILKPIRWLAKKAWDWTWGASKNLLNGIFSVAGTIISLPFKALGITGSMITAYEKVTGGEYKDDLKAARQKADDYYKEHEENFKLRMKDLDEDEKQYKYERKQARKSGYALSEAQLQEKTDKYHEELRTIEEEQRKAEAEAAQRRLVAESQREELKELLREANLKLEGFTENGKAILSNRKSKAVITNAKGELKELKPVLAPAGSSAGMANKPVKAGSTGVTGTTTAGATTGTAAVRPAKVNAGRARAEAKGLATSSAPIAAASAGLPPQVGAMAAGAAGSAGTVTIMPVTTVPAEGAQSIEKPIPMRTPHVMYHSSNGSGSGAHHGAPGVHHASMSMAAPTVQSAGLARQDRMYDLVTQFYAMVEYKFDDMLGYNDIAINKEDSNFSTIIKGGFQALGMHLFNSLIEGRLGYEIASAKEMAKSVIRAPGQALTSLGSRLENLDTLDDEDSWSGGLRRRAGRAGTRTRELGERYNDMIGYHGEEIGPSDPFGRQAEMVILDLISQKSMSIENYLLGDQASKLDKMVDLLGDIKSNTASSSGPPIGHVAAGGLIRRTGSYILSAGERVVRGARNTINDIRRDAEAEGSFFNGMKKRGNDAINAGMQAMASAIGSLKGYLKDIAESTKRSAAAAMVQLSSLGKGAVRAASVFARNPKASIMRGAGAIKNAATGALRDADSKVSSIFGGQTADQAGKKGFSATLMGALGFAKSKASEGVDKAKGALRDADSKVSSIFGGRTADVIIKEREEAKYRHDVLDALKRNNNTQIKQEEKKDSLWDWLKNLLSGALPFITGPLAAIAATVASILAFLGNRPGDGSNGGEAEQEDAQRKVGMAAARKIGGAIAKPLYKTGRAVVRGGMKVGRAVGRFAYNKLGMDGFKYGAGAAQAADKSLAKGMDKLAHMDALGKEITELESKAALTAEEAAALSQKKADKAILEKALIEDNAKYKQFMQQAAAKNPFEAKSMQLKDSIKLAEQEGAPFKKKLLEGLETLASKASGAVQSAGGKEIMGKKVSEWIGSFITRIKNFPPAKLAKFLGEKAPKVAAGAAGVVPGPGWIINAAFAGVSGVIGWNDASELLGVNPEDTTYGMKLTVAIVQAVTSLPYIVWLDIAIELCDALGGTAIKRYILSKVYNIVCEILGEDSNLEELQQKNQAEYATYKNKEIDRLINEEGLSEDEAKKKADKTASYRKFMDEKDNAYHPVLDMARKIPGASYFLGKNDENGNFQKGLFANMKDVWSESPVWNTLSPLGWADVGITAAYRTGFGGKNKEGVETKGILSDTYFGKSVANNVNWLFGENKPTVNYFDLGDPNNKMALIQRAGYDPTMFSYDAIVEWDPTSGVLPDGTILSKEEKDLVQWMIDKHNADAEADAKRRERGVLGRGWDSIKDSVGNNLAYLFGEEKPFVDLFDMGDPKNKIAIIQRAGYDPTKYSHEAIVEWDPTSGVLPDGTILSKEEKDLVQWMIDKHNADAEADAKRRERGVIGNALAPVGDAIANEWAYFWGEEKPFVDLFDLGDPKNKIAIIQRAGYDPTKYSYDAIVEWDPTSGVLPDGTILSQEEKDVVQWMIDKHNVDAEEAAKIREKGVVGRTWDTVKKGLAYIFGDEDENGEYKNDLYNDIKSEVEALGKSVSDGIDGVRTRINNELAYVFGEEGKQSGLGQDIWGKGIDLYSWFFGVDREDAANMLNTKSDQLAKIVKDARDGVVKFATDMGDSIGKQWDETRENVRNNIAIAGKMWDNFKDRTGKAIDQAIDEGAILANNIGDTVAKHRDELAANIESGMVTAGKMWDSLKDRTGEAIDSAISGIKDVLGVGKGRKGPFIAALFGEEDVYDPETGELKYKGKKSIFSQFIDSAGDAISGFGQDIRKLFNRAIDWIWDGVSGIGKDIRDGFRKWWAGTADTMLGTGTKYQERAGTDFNNNLSASRDSQMSSFTGQGDGDYSQNDPRWATAPYGPTSSFAGSGCGPTVMASILSRMGKKVNPYEMGVAAAGAGYKTPGGTNEKFLPDSAAVFGVKSNKLSSMKDIIGSVRSGKEVVVGGMSGAGIGPFTKAGHYALVSGIDGGSAILSDPRGFDRRVGLGDLARDTKTAYSFEGNGLGDVAFPDFSRLKTTTTGVFPEFLKVTGEWFDAGGPLSPLFYIMKQGFGTLKQFYEDNISKPIGEFSERVKDSVLKVAKPIIDFAEKAASTIQSKGLMKGTFSILKDMIGGFFGVNLDDTPIAKGVEAMIDKIGWGIDKVRGTFTTIGNKFNEVEKKIQSWVMDSFIGTAFKAVIDWVKEKASGPITTVIDTVQDWWSKYGAKSFGLGGAGLQHGIPKNITPGKGTKDFEAQAFMNYMIGGAGGGDVNFAQNDGNWGSKSLVAGNPSYGSMEKIGCGPTTFATSWMNAGGTGKIINPGDAMKLVGSGDVAYNGSKGVTPKFFPKAAHAMGGEFYAINPYDTKSIENAVGGGASIVAGGRSDTNDGSKLFTTGGHYANIKGGFVKDGETYVHANDPLNRGRSTYKLNDVVKDIQSGGPNMIGVMSPDGSLPAGVKAIPMGSAMYGGAGNTMYMAAQSGEDCTLHAAAALMNAYTGSNKKNSDYSFSTWYPAIKGMPSTEYQYSKNQRSEFENTLKTHFDSHPEYPVYLYQTGGDGNHGGHTPHAINRVSGNHATVIGRKLSSGKYEVYDSNGGVIHQLDLNQIFDPTAKGSARNYTGPHESNLLLIPKNPPSQPITTWKSAKGVSSGGSAAADAAKALKIDIRGKALCGGAKRSATNGVVVHHTGVVDANNKPQDVDLSASEINDMHKKRGWNGIGYHFVIRKNGVIERGREEEAVGAHAPHEAGRPSNLSNSDTIGINVAGTFMGSFKPTEKQIESLKKLIAYLAAKYKFPVDRKHVIGHRETTNTDCPGDNLFAMLPSIVDGAKTMVGSIGGTDSATGAANGKPLGFLAGLTQLFTTVGKDYVNALLSGKAYTGSDLSFLTGNSSSSSGSNAPGNEVVVSGEDEKSIWDYLTKNGYEKETAAGIMGCWAKESSNKPGTIEGYYLKGYPGNDTIINNRDATDSYVRNILWPATRASIGSINEGGYRDPGDGHLYPGIGLPQWTGGRGKRFIEFTKSNNLKWDSLSTQLRFMNKEMKEVPRYKAAIDRANASKNIDTATWEFMKYYEGNTSQSFYNKRLSAAKQIYAKYAGTSGPGGSGFGTSLSSYLDSGLYGGGGNTNAYWANQRAQNKKSLLLARQRRAELEKIFGIKPKSKSTTESINGTTTTTTTTPAQTVAKPKRKRHTFGDIFWNSQLGGIARSLGFKSPQQKAAEKLARERALQAKQMAEKQKADANATKAAIAKVLTAAEIVKQYGIKDTDFDEFGNLKLLKDVDKAIINNGTQDDKLKYTNQYKQLQLYMKQCEEAKKAKAAEIKKIETLSFNTAHSGQQHKATVNGTQSVIVKPSAPAVDTAIASSGTSQALVSELKELNIRKEANQMVHYLQIIAKNQYEMARWLNPGAAKAGAGAGTGGSTPTRTAQSNMEKPPAVPPNQGFDRKTNVSGKKDYSAIHAKNVEIARGGFFKDS